MPEADKIVPLVAQAGHVGMTRYEIGGVIDLERESLDRLLAGLTRFGMLKVSQENGVLVYRSGSVA